MSDPTTPFLGLTKPIVGDEAGEDLWGDKLNGNFDKIDASNQDLASDITALQTTAITEAPVDGKPYGRKDAHWYDVSSLPVDWSAILNKPSTFPPTLPIAQSGVSGLLADQATQDSNISANAAAIGTKEPTIAAGTTAQYWRGDKSWQTLDKAAVGLDNVDNTSDANKPISTATATALAGKEPTIAPGTTAQYWRGDKTWQAFPAPAIATDAPSDGAVYGRLNGAWSSVSASFVAKTGATGAGVLPAGTTAQRPTAATGQIRFNTDLTTFEGYNGTAWGTIGGGSITISDTPPSSPSAGNLWWESDTGKLFVYYSDPNTSQWVETHLGVQGLGDAPSDGVLYGRYNGVWTRAAKANGDALSGAYAISNGSLSATQAAGASAGSYAVQGTGTGSGGGVAGFSPGGTTWGVLGASGGYSFQGSGTFQNTGGGAFSAALTIGGPLTWSNITNFIMGFGGGANISTGTSAFDLMFAGTSFYSWRSTYYGPTTDNALYCGVSGQRWVAVYAVTGTIQTSDEREKQDIRPLEEREKAAARRLRDLVCAYRWKDRPQKLYVGIIAQRVEEALAAEGLDPTAYAMWSAEPIMASKPARIEDGQIIEEAGLIDTGEVRYQVDYAQLAMFILGGLVNV